MSTHENSLFQPTATMLISVCLIMAAISTTLASCNPEIPRWQPSPQHTPTPVVVCVPATDNNSQLTSNNYPELNSIAMLSPTEGWAVGASTDTPILHYINQAWYKLPGATMLGSEFYSVRMLSENEGIIGGEYSMIIRYHNGCWQRDYVNPSAINSRPNPPVSSVALLSPTEAWATTDELLHYTAGSWQHVALAQPHKMRSIYMLSSSEGWAVGDFGSILHYQAGAWNNVDNPLSKRSDLNLHCVQFISASEGWAVGGNTLGKSDAVILHYTGGKWEVQDSPPSRLLSSLSMLSPNEGWAVGNKYVVSKNQELAVIMHYKDGRWKEDTFSMKGELRSIQMLSPEEGWAVGVTEDGKSGLILHYQAGKWLEYQYR